MKQEPSEFNDVVFSASSLWARRWWIVLGLALGGLAAGAFVYTLPETNRSWAQVLVRPLGVDLTRGAVNIDRAIDHVAERELAGSFIVAEMTADRISTPVSARTLRREVLIDGAEDSAVIEFSYSSESAEQAREIAQTFAESYLEIRSDLAASTRDDARDALEERQRELVAEREKLRQERDGLNDDDRLANLSAESAVANQLTLVANDIALIGALTSDPGQVISPAQLAERSERPRAVPTIVAGALLGGLLGVLAALFLDRGLRDRDLTNDDLGELGLAPLAHLPRQSRGADAFVGLLGRVTNELQGDEKVVAFTTASADSEGVQVAPWFAWNLADAGHRVLLVSADFLNRSIAKQFGLSDDSGLLNALVSGSGPEAVAQQVGSLHVVTVGEHPADPISVLQMVGMSRFLRRAKQDYDSVVIHAPHAAGREASLLALWAAEAVCVVIDDEDRGELTELTELLARTDARLIGSAALIKTNR